MEDGGWEGLTRAFLALYSRSIELPLTSNKQKQKRACNDFCLNYGVQIIVLFESSTILHYTTCEVEYSFLLLKILFIPQFSFF